VLKLETTKNGSLGKPMIPGGAVFFKAPARRGLLRGGQAFLGAQGSGGEDIYIEKLFLLHGSAKRVCVPGLRGFGNCVSRGAGPTSPGGGGEVEGQGAK